MRAASLRTHPRCTRMRPVHLAASSGAAQQDAGAKRTRVLFVCLGNICRSPSAEAMFRAVAEREGVAAAFDIDSCGTGGGASNWYKPGGWSYHEGDPADERMAAAATRRGVALTSRSRPLSPSDLTASDHIVVMDAKNKRDVMTAAQHWIESGRVPGVTAEQVLQRVSLMTAYCTQKGAPDYVPDPYYGGPQGFETVLDLLDDACSGLLQHIQQQQQQQQQ